MSAPELERLLSAADTAAGQLQRVVLKHLQAKHADHEIPTSIRFVFYELEQRGQQSKMVTGKRKPAQNLTDAVTRLREVGGVPWDWIVDDTRSIAHLDGWPSIMLAARVRAETARLAPWADTDQPFLITESKSTGGVLERRVAERYCVPVAATSGQCRGFLETEVAKVLRSLDRVRILYLGDHDLQGDQIEANARSVLERALDRPLLWETGRDHRSADGAPARQGHATDPENRRPLRQARRGRQTDRPHGDRLGSRGPRSDRDRAPGPGTSRPAAARAASGRSGTRGRAARGGARGPGVAHGERAMSAPHMLKLATLWQRKSSKTGKTYFSGFWGEEITRENGEVVQTWKLLAQGRDPERRPQQKAALLETGTITVHHNERRDPRAAAVEKWSARFEPDQEPPF